MILFIDDDRDDPHRVGESQSFFCGVCGFEVNYWSGGYGEACRRINRLELIDDQNLVVFIHERVSMDRYLLREDRTITGKVEDIIDLIRQTNSEARVVVYSGSSNLPWRRIVVELKADGYISVPSEIEDWEYFYRKGGVSEEEKRERGKSVELANRPRRYNPEGLMMRCGRVERDMTSE
jgi:hypothetical protein